MELNSFNPLSITKYWKDMKPPDLNQLKKDKAKFTDNYFLPNTNTLLSVNANDEYIDQVEGPKNENKMSKALLHKLEWRRISSMSSPWTLFKKDKIECSDVLQGELGDCYFLGSIAALASYPYLIAEKFKTKEYNDIGYYEMIFFIDGEWQIVFVDDYTLFNVPCDCISFCHPNNDHVIWPLLLEKAWAKINGGYTNIIGGDSSDALFALTSFPTKKEETSENDPQTIFNNISKCNREGTILTTSIKDNCIEAEQYGLISDHAYSILKVKSKPDDDIYLIQLRNPWGKTDWKGEWSERSVRWTSELKRHFNYKDSSDGAFWMSINDFFFFFSSYNICHLMYGSLIKNYYFIKEKYFKAPIVYSINIKQASDVSVSVIFKHWRFNRNIKNTQRPLALILSKLDATNEVEKLYLKRTSNEDIHLFESLPAGNYFLWIYCYFKHVKNDPNFSFTLSLKSKSDFVSKFVALDTDFNLLQKIAISHYNKKYSDEEDRNKTIYLGYDRKLPDSGITSYIICNCSNTQWAEITLTPKLTNLLLLPPFQKMNKISLTIPPQRKIPILAMRITNEASSFQIQTSTMMVNNPQGNIPEELTCSRFFHNNFEESQAQLKSSLISKEYRFVKKEQLFQLPVFKKEQYVPEEIFKRSMIKLETITIESLKKEYPEEMKLMLKLAPLFNSEAVLLDKIPSTDGLYIGEIDKITSLLQGRGIYLWSNRYRYIGYWLEGNMHYYGTLYDPNWNKEYEGEYLNGKKEGLGVLYINKGERIEGKFSNDTLNGNGKYIFSNGSYWEGPFVNNLRHGMGIITYDKIKKYEVFYYYGEYIGKYEKVKELNQDKITKEVSGMDKETAQKKNKDLKKKETNNKIKQTKSNQKENEFNLLDLEDYSKFLRIEENPFIKEEVKESEQERNEKMIESLRLSDTFMIDQILLLPQMEEKEMFNKITKSNITKIGCMINGKLNGRGAIFNEKYYDIGYFKDDLPNGFFRKYHSNKTIYYEGILNKDSSPINGKLYFSDGTYYNGSISPKWKLSGYGVMYNKKGESWTGNFEESLMSGSGKNIMDNGFMIRNLFYEKGKIVSISSYIPYDYLDNSNINILSCLKNQDEIMYNALLLLKPNRSLINPVWKRVICKSEDYIIGETDEKGNFNGRGCRIFKQGIIKYYVGYFNNNSLDDTGTFFNENWGKIYEGQMANNSRNGFGKEYLSSGKIYIGYFKDNLFQGQGVIILPNGRRFEGIFNKGYRHGKGFEINNPPTSKQPIEYKEGNVVSQQDNIKCNTLLFRNSLKKEFDLMKTKYPNHFQLFQKLKPTEDNAVLMQGEKYYPEGYYIGELNNIGFRHGRGIQFAFNKISFYVGYFQYNQKQGSGTYFIDLNNIKYQGQFKDDAPFGKGKYYNSEGESFEGNFNERGEGKGIFNFKNGGKWFGEFNYFMRNGKGEYYDEKNKHIGVISYNYNVKVN